MGKCNEKITLLPYNVLIEEAKKILIKLGYKTFIYDSSFIDDVISKLMEADFRWQPNRGAKLSTLRMRYVINLCKKKYKKSKTNLKIEPFPLNKIVDINQDSYKNLLCKEIYDFVQKSGNERQRHIFQLYFLDGYNSIHTATKLGISKQRVCQYVSELRTMIIRKFGDDLEN